MRQRTLVVGFVVFAVVLSVQPVTGQQGGGDEFPDECDAAEVISDGTYSDRLTPDDTDVFLLDLDDGDYITGKLSWDYKTISSIYFSSPSQERYADFDVTGSNNDPDEYVGINYVSSDRERGAESDGTVRFELTATKDQETQGQPVCVSLSTIPNNRATSWTLEFSTNSPTIQTNGTSAQTNGTADERVAELESELEEKNQRISELESQLNQTQSQNQAQSQNGRVDDLEQTVEQKNRRISELETQVNQLVASQNPLERDDTRRQEAVADT